MTKYIFKRLLHGMVSIVIAIGIIMALIYGVMDRNLIFAKDSVYSHQANNQKETYKYQKWEEYGYLDYVTYADYLMDLYLSGEIDEETRSSAVSFGRDASKDSEIVTEYIGKFTEYYESKGYTVRRLDAVTAAGKKLANGGAQQLFAYKDLALYKRLLSYFTGIISIDDVNYVESDVEDRGLSFTLYDPVYGGDKFSPALMGNGTKHKYLLWFDGQFPYIHQNIVKINLGTSYSVNAGVDVFDTMTRKQGSYVKSEITYPTGLVEMSADDLHTATYAAGTLETGILFADRYVDDYTSVSTVKKNPSQIGYSFIIGVISVIMAYVLGVPLGLLMARKKDKFADKLGTAYIVFISAVPSLGYIYIFKAVGGSMGFPTTFDMESTSKLMFVLPIVSLALPSVASLMKWVRRYMIDQMNSDYVKFARSGGLSETEIFSKHILKNAVIPIVQGVPAAFILSMTGAFITESVYVVPGVGGVMIKAVQQYDNAVIIGVALFYAILSIVSLILGDVLMALIDPRISFSEKDR